MPRRYTILLFLLYSLLLSDAFLNHIPLRDRTISWQPFSLRRVSRACIDTHICSADRDEAPPLGKEPPLKVLVLVEPTPFNYVCGYANRFKEMLSFLRKAGDEVRVLTPDKDQENYPKEFLGFPIESPRGWDFPLYKDVTITFDTKLKIPEILRDFKPDIVHVSSPSAIIIPAIIWARKFDIPLVMSYHTDLPGYAKNYVPLPGSVALANFLVRSFHKPADLVLCTSPQLRDAMTAAKIRRVDVWQKGINTQVFAPHFRDNETRMKLSDGHPDAPLLLYVGRLGAEKKIHRLTKVLDKCPSARLVLVGSGPADASLRKTFEGYPVHFAGQLSGDALSKAFASCDIFTMTSDTETLGFVVMEAMASGLPAVGVAAGGVVDIIDHGETGYLAENTDDMEQFSSFVKQLIDESELRRRLGDAAVAWAQDWSWEAATSRLRNVQYRKAIALHRARDESRRHVPDIEAAIMQCSSYRVASPDSEQ